MAIPPVRLRCEEVAGRMTSEPLKVEVQRSGLSDLLLRG